MTGNSTEPSILDMVALETKSGAEWVSHAATIANMTDTEVWLGVRDAMTGLVSPGDVARIVLELPEAGALVADTRVVRLLGASARVVALKRPESWRFPSRRTDGRMSLAIPAYLRPPDMAVVPARTTNLGVGGFRCIASIPVAVGHRMPVSIQLTPVESLDCMAQVVRLEDCPDDPTGRQCLVAFRFLDLAEDQEATIAAALLALANEADGATAPRAWRSDSAAGVA